MQNWKTRISNREVRFRRGIFRGDSLAPLIFVICLIPISRALKQAGLEYSLGRGKVSVSHLWFMDDCKLYAKDSKQQQKQVQILEEEAKKTGMAFGLSKCASQTMKRGRITEAATPTTVGGEKLPRVPEHGYKYLGMLQTDLIDHKQMKEKLTAEYKARVRKILRKTHLNAANTIKAINTWAVSVLRYSAGIVKWTKEESRQLDRDTRKLLAAERMFNMNGDVDRLYIRRREGGKGLISVEDCIRQEDQNLRNYIHSLPKTALTAASQESHPQPEEVPEESRKKRYQEKKLHGQFERQTREIRDTESTFRWLQTSQLKRETEALIMAAQEQSLRTNSIKCHIDKTVQSDRCRACKTQPETAEHLTGGCPKLAQKEYKRRHDKLAMLVHWHLLRQHDIETTPQWYRHEPRPVTETDKVKILWDLNIQTARIIEARRPDIVRVDKINRTAIIIDIAVPIDRNVAAKMDEKQEKYQDLAAELKSLWKLRKLHVVPVVIGALGTVPKTLTRSLRDLEMTKAQQDLLQKAALLGTARILRRILSLPGDRCEARG